VTSKRKELAYYRIGLLEISNRDKEKGIKLIQTTAESGNTIMMIS
jgi:hypothetical protein